METVLAAIKRGKELLAKGNVPSKKFKTGPFESQSVGVGPTVSPSALIKLRRHLFSAVGVWKKGRTRIISLHTSLDNRISFDLPRFVQVLVRRGYTIKSTRYPDHFLRSWRLVKYLVKRRGAKVGEVRPFGVGAAFTLEEKHAIPVIRIIFDEMKQRLPMSRRLPR